LNGSKEKKKPFSLFNTSSQREQVEETPSIKSIKENKQLRED
jgi:hypothetical protein